MRLTTRSIAFAVVVSLLGAGPLATFARAQQAQPPAREPQAMPEPVIFEEPSESTVGYALAATIMNFAFVPGKAVTCVLGMAVGGGLLLVTLGAAYKGSMAFAKEGCGGKWVLTAKDLRGTDYILGVGERRE